MSTLANPVGNPSVALPPIVLVVDDRQENLESMQTLLGDDPDWRVRCVSSGEAALQCLLHEDVSLVLLDVQMPGMDGYEVAQLMRGNPRTRYTPIIFLSAIVHTQDSILRGYDRGAVDFILKPFDPLVLRQKIHNLLAYENNRRELQTLSRQLERERGLNASILANAAEGVMVVGEDGFIQYANPAMATMVGGTVSDLQGNHFLALLDAPEGDGLWRESPFYEHWRNRKTYRLLDAGLRKTDQTVLPITLSCAPLPSPQRAMVAVVRDISVERELRERLESLIVTDPLTGLLNRRGFYQVLTQALARAKRVGDYLAVLYLDLDGFKKVNDMHGHEAGDALLRHIGEQMRTGVRSNDSVARLGGDEFTILLDDLQHCAEAVRVAEKLIARLTEPYVIGGEDMRVRVSVGVACYPDSGKDTESLLRAADLAMYEAKRSDAQKHHIHSSTMTERARARLHLERRLRHAIEAQQFILAYQPQFCLDSGKLRGFEALLRWPQGKAEAIQPGDFIPQLEETRLINPLGQWILNEGIARLADLRRQFGEAILLSLNVSPIQFVQPQLVDTIAQVLKTHGLPAHQLELEVTESVLMQDIAITQAHLSHLQALGVQVAIDDFGTGYSSLAYLREFDLNVLKIDRLFIANMLDSPRDAAVVNTIIDLCRHLGLQVIAEGVETAAQRDRLLEHGCDIMQGWLVAPALPFEAALRVPAQLDWQRVPLQLV